MFHGNENTVGKSVVPGKSTAGSKEGYLAQTVVTEKTDWITITSYGVNSI